MVIFFYFTHFLGKQIFRKQIFYIMLYCPKCMSEFAVRRALQAHLLRCRFTEPSSILTSSAKKHSRNIGSFHGVCISSPNKGIENQENDDNNFNIFNDDNTCEANIEDYNNDTSSVDCNSSANNVTSSDYLLVKAKKYYNSE
jgi:hypothetical protein